MTTDRQIKAVARALWDLHKTEMGEVWYEQNATWENLTAEAKNSFRKEAKAAIEASDAKYVPMLVEALRFYRDNWDIVCGNMEIFYLGISNLIPNRKLLMDSSVTAQRVLNQLPEDLRNA